MSKIAEIQARFAENAAEESQPTDDATRQATSTGKLWKSAGIKSTAGEGKKTAKKGAKKITVKPRPGEAQGKPQNTYHLEPQQPFKVKAVEAILQEVMREQLEKRPNLRPSGNKAQISRIISDKAVERVRTLGYSRYKYVCWVCLGDSMGQAVRAVSQMLNLERTGDNYAEATYQSGTQFCCCVLFAVGYD